MYHGRFVGTHYNVGYKWGSLLLKKGKSLDYCPAFELTEDRYAFAKECVIEYRKHFPEVLEEIQGIADGNKVPTETLHALLFSMYCFELDNKCTCFAVSTDDEIIFARNSDFLVSLEKLYMNCLYNLKDCYSFNGNTTAFVQMEDGVNIHGLAVGITFVYPHLRKPGLNAGMLARYFLEKCKTTEEVLTALHQLPVASAQTFTIADKSGEIVVVECNPREIAVIHPRDGDKFVATANNFNSEKMKAYRNPGIDDWRSGERYQTVYTALEQNKDGYTVAFARDVLAGKYGFTCQYNRKQGADTVWSVIYDLKRKQIWRVEGNPARKCFKEDSRLKLI